MVPVIAALGAIDKVLAFAKPFSGVPVVKQLLGSAEQVGKTVETRISKAKLGATGLLAAAPDWNALLEAAQAGDKGAWMKLAVIGISYGLAIYGRSKADQSAGKNGKRGKGAKRGRKPRVAAGETTETQAETAATQEPKRRGRPPRSARQIVSDLEGGNGVAGDAQEEANA